MIYTIKYSTTSKHDLQKTVDYINNVLQNHFAGNRLRIKIQSTIKNLKTFPHKYPLIDDLMLTPYKIRFFPIKNYLLFYTIIEETKTIYIIRFLYSRRNWQHILQHTVQYDEYLSQNTGGYVHEEQEEYGKQFKKGPTSMTESPITANDNIEFDEDIARQELLNELQKGLDDIKAGRTIPAEEVYVKLAKKFEEYDFE
ncbi:MAG: type II toxin-antitoxin system RelE/ParE family toxin [Phascolarctobacterium sp.]|nr:type II toxin-antitoxin system RelE/ParE family toxin [Phascolarctobacterium sp.]